MTVPTEDKLKMEVYGDSITCGYGALGDVTTNPNQFLTAEEDATSTYAYKTAQTLGAEINVVAHQGWAISRSRWVAAETADDKALTLPAIYDKVTDAHGAAWDFTSYQADIVIVNLGTNDYVNTVTPATDTGDAYFNDFVWKYYVFLQNLRAKYATAKFVLCYGMMDDSSVSRLQEAIAWVKSACDGNAGEGNPAIDNVITVDLTGSDGMYTGGGGAHPSAAQHTTAANNLVAALRSAGWIS